MDKGEKIVLLRLVDGGISSQNAVVEEDTVSLEEKVNLLTEKVEELLRIVEELSSKSPMPHIPQARKVDPPKSKKKKGQKRQVAPVGGDPFLNWKHEMEELLYYTKYTSFAPIYEELRKVYGIVWEQEAKDTHNKRWSHIAYNNSQFKSIFENTLKNMTHDKKHIFDPTAYAKELSKHDPNSSGNKTILWHMTHDYGIDWNKELEKFSNKYPDLEADKLECIRKNNRLKTQYIATFNKLIKR